MTMEMVESQQDGNAVDSMRERDAVHVQNQPGQSQISPISQVSVAASSAGRGSPAVTLVQLPSGQTVHVQGVIQATQPSVIQSPQMQAVQHIWDRHAKTENLLHGLEGGISPESLASCCCYLGEQKSTFCCIE